MKDERLVLQHIKDSASPPPVHIPDKQITDDAIAMALKRSYATIPDANMITMCKISDSIIMPDVCILQFDILNCFVLLSYVDQKEKLSDLLEH